MINCKYNRAAHVRVVHFMFGLPTHKVPKRVDIEDPSHHRYSLAPILHTRPNPSKNVESLPTSRLYKLYTSRINVYIKITNNWFTNRETNFAF